MYSCIYGDSVANAVTLGGVTAKQYCRGSYINNGVTEYIYVDRSKLTYSNQSEVCKVKTPDPVEEEKPGTSTPDPTPGTSTPDPTPSTSECQYNYEPKTQQTTTEAVSLPICYQYKNGKFTADI